MNYKKVVCLDLEQCCWEDKTPGDIIQIGLAEVDVATGHIDHARSFYVSTTEEISPYCTALTGITPRVVAKQGRSLDKVLQTIYTKIGTRNKVYLSWGNDFVTLREQCIKHNAEYRFDATIDLSLLFHIRIAAIQSGVSHKWALDGALAHFGRQFEGTAHNAMDDAINTCFVAHKLLSKMSDQP